MASVRHFFDRGEVLLAPLPKVAPAGVFSPYTETLIVGLVIAVIPFVISRQSQDGFVNGAAVASNHAGR
jgi:hypothetical protein